MTNLRFGMKIYGNEWFLRHGLQPEEAADVLDGMGVTFVISQSRFLPMADSAVKSTVTGSDKQRYAALDDVAFRQALGQRGIIYFGVLNICFDPDFVARFPEDLPVDQFGRVEEKIDWYMGIPPDRQNNIAHKIGLLKDAVKALDPDAIHLGFMRWPGFWETWLPDVDRTEMPDYCYAPQTLGRFAAATGLEIPVDDPRASAATIARHHRDAWRDWKCGETVRAVGQIRTALDPIKEGLAYAINTLPFFRGDFGNAVEEVFGQDIGRLAEVIDIFEVMAYHQILRQPATWPAAVAENIKARSGRRTICTLQARPLYLDGMHAGRGRSETLDADEFSQAVDALEESSVDGLCVFTFADFLEFRETRDMRGIIRRLGRFRV